LGINTPNNKEEIDHLGSDVMMVFQLAGAGFLTLFFGAMISQRPLARR